jgi:hypothetical protein
MNIKKNLTLKMATICLLGFGFAMSGDGIDTLSCPSPILYDTYHFCDSLKTRNDTDFIFVEIHFKSPLYSDSASIAKWKENIVGLLSIYDIRTYYYNNYQRIMPTDSGYEKIRGPVLIRKMNLIDLLNEPIVKSIDLRALIATTAHMPEWPPTSIFNKNNRNKIASKSECDALGRKIEKQVRSPSKIYLAQPINK